MQHLRFLVKYHIQLYNSTRLETSIAVFQLDFIKKFKIFTFWCMQLLIYVESFVPLNKTDLLFYDHVLNFLEVRGNEKICKC
jgi:hypothetical protein